MESQGSIDVFFDALEDLDLDSVDSKTGDDLKVMEEDKTEHSAFDSKTGDDLKVMEEDKTEHSAFDSKTGDDLKVTKKDKTEHSAFNSKQSIDQNSEKSESVQRSLLSPSSSTPPPPPPHVPKRIPSPDKAAGGEKQIELKSQESPVDKTDQETPTRSNFFSGEPRGRKHFKLNPKEKEQNIVNSRPDDETNLSAKSPISTDDTPTDEHSKYDRIEKRVMLSLEKSLRDLLEEPGGKLAIASRVDPSLPPSPFPSPGIREKNVAASFIKRQIKTSSIIIRKSFVKNKDAPPPSHLSEDSNMSHRSYSSPPISITDHPLNSHFNNRVSFANGLLNIPPHPPPFRPGSPSQSSITTNSDPVLSRDYYQENLLGDESDLSTNDDFSEIDSLGVNSYQFQGYDKNTGELIDSDKMHQTSFLPLDTEPEMVLRSSRRKNTLSPDSIHAAEIAAARTLSPSTSSVCTDVTESKRKKFSFRRFKKNTWKAPKKNNTDKSPPISPTKSAKLKDNITFALPANSVPVRYSGRKFKKTNNSFASNSNPMLLIQSLQNVHDGPIWCSAFSPDGKYLATAGQDSIIKIWEVCPSHKTSDVETEAETAHSSRMESHENIEEKEDKYAPNMVGGAHTFGREIKLFASKPIQTYDTHIGDILDLSWSTSSNSQYFLLSASVDKTVKLWHVSRQQALLTFQHTDLVTSVHFHPYDENYFISTGYDKKIRLWNIPKERVQEWAGAPEIITRGRFSPDGRFVVAGLMTGQVYFYTCSLNETNNLGGVGQGLRYYTQIACKNRSGKNKAGRKVTGLAFVSGVRIEHESKQTNRPGVIYASATAAVRRSSTRKWKKFAEHLLVTTNDSRLRLYGMDDFCMIRKYKGLVNTSLLVNAHISETGKFCKKHYQSNLSNDC